LAGTFRSLRVRNYRIWASGAIVSNIGTWMQRVAQDWVVLTQLTHHNASAVGIVMALQFGPVAVLLPVTGMVADRFDRRRVLMVTQASMGLLALCAATLLGLGWLRLWHVWGLALLLGILTAFDSPCRQTFVSELVGDKELSNAVALNSSSFNLGRMIGPAAAGAMIAAVGSAWVFLLNALSFIAVLTSLSLLRVGELHRAKRRAAEPGDFLAGFGYIRKRPDLITVLSMLFLIGTFGLNFPIYISTMAVSVFHVDAGRFGILTTMMAGGSVAGALLSARRTGSSIELLSFAAVGFGVLCGVAALMPHFVLFGAVLVILGLVTQTFTTSGNAYVQIATAPEMRGRVMAILLALSLGGTLFGAPIVGWVGDRMGPRWSMGCGALAGICAGLMGCIYWLRQRRVSVTADDSATR